METINLSKKRFDGAYSRIFSSLVPSRIKRLIVISSLFSIMSKNKAYDENSLKELNVEFGLCRNCSAMNLPISYGEKIWTKVDSDKDLSCKEYPNEGVVRKSRRIVDKMPCWLIYDKLTVVMKDIRKLFKFSSNQQADVDNK